MDIVTYALCKKYTDATAKGLGILKGANCTIKDVEELDDKTIITFAWKDTDNNEQTIDVEIPCGPKGEQGLQGERGLPGLNGKDGKDGEDGAKGEDGFSPSIVTKTNTDSEYVLSITTKEGTFDTPNLKGRNGSGGGGTDLNECSSQDILDLFDE